MTSPPARGMRVPALPTSEGLPTMGATNGGAMRIELRRWSTEDLPVLQRANTPEMTAHLGGPETEEQLVERQARYLRLNDSGQACMLRIDVDGVPAGGIGYWETDHDGVRAFEAGWGVEPPWQGLSLIHI